jgi:hypothetical protein
MVAAPDHADPRIPSLVIKFFKYAPRDFTPCQKAMSTKLQRITPLPVCPPTLRASRSNEPKANRDRKAD